jgi:hypothetical protein
MDFECIETWLVSHKFSVQNREIEFALPDEGELKK